MGQPFQRRSVDMDGLTFAYQVWLPAGWTRERLWPVVLFLHGAGESGDDGLRQTTVGLGPALRAQPERWPALAVFPQCRPGVGWRGLMLRQAVAALDATIEEFGGDIARQCLTGISMGGYGTWRLALDEPTRFAALVPVCGGLDASPRAAHAAAPTDPHIAAAAFLREIPIWVFHGAVDQIIPVEESRVMVEALRQAGGTVRYKEYPGVGHDSWTRAYAEPELPEWLLAQTRRGKSA